jgi:hypothetical protein
LIAGNIAQVLAAHREVRRYRRAMANNAALASLTGPPANWN